jgi:hypothetical protein
MPGWTKEDEFTNLDKFDWEIPTSGGAKNPAQFETDSTAPEDLFLKPENFTLNPEEIQSGPDQWTVEAIPSDD